MVQSLRLVPLLIKQLSQFGQYATVGGAYADDVHQPLDRLLRIFQQLIYGAGESRAVGNGDRTVVDTCMVSEGKSLSQGYRLANWYMTSALFLRMA